jgi:hypothetical protein
LHNNISDFYFIQHGKGVLGFWGPKNPKTPVIDFIVRIKIAKMSNLVSATRLSAMAATANVFVDVGGPPEAAYLRSQEAPGR